MTRLGGLAGAAAAFALTAALACDAGGFNPLSFDRALVAVCSVTLVVVLLAGGARPGRHVMVLLASLWGLTAWTAASWLWSDSPPAALEEAQRVALYAATAALVVLVGRRVEPRWIAAGVVAAATFTAAWNLVTRVTGVSHPGDSGALAEPVGYANGLAMLCVFGLLLLPALPRPAVVAATFLFADLWLQKSTGAIAALMAGVLAFAFVASRRARIAVAAVALACVVAAPFVLRGHERGRYWHVAVAEAQANPVLGSGAGTFADWWLRERPVPLSTQEAHSLYIETLAESGPIGLALVLLALAVPVAAAVQTRRPAFAAALVAFDVGAAVDFHWELSGVTLPAVLIGASVVVHASPRMRDVSRVSVVPALAALTVAAILAYAGNARLGAAEDALRAGDATRAVSEARGALRFAPFSADAWRVLGDAESSAADYRRALELDRNDWLLWQRLAAVSKGEQRRLALREAALLNPLASGP